MGWPKCNTTLEDMTLSEDPIYNGHTFHYLGLWLSAITGIIAVLLSFFLIFMHATHYLRPYEQRHIIRILFMVPIYATVSFLSFKYYLHSVYFEVLRDCYEAFAIASFFSLLCSYLAEDLHSQKEYFRGIKPRNWVWPMSMFQKCTGGPQGKLRIPRSGLTWFNVIWVCVFQYCFIRVAMTCVALVTQVFGVYCLESLNPAFAHVWVMVIEALAVTIAMYCLIQFYIQIKGDIQEHSPLQKITAIKLVIFLSFWQSLLISFLTSAGAIKASNTIQTPDIKIGIPAMLLCIEMALFAVFHFFAFSWRPYVLNSAQFRASTLADGHPTPTRYRGGPLGILALADAFNPWDLVKAIGRSARWLFVGRKQRHQDVSYQGTRMNTNLKHEDSDQEHDSNGATAYKPPRTALPVADDRETLLSASQPMPVGSLNYAQASRESSPYRADGRGYVHSGDVGVALPMHSESHYYSAPPPRLNEQHPYYRQQQQNYQQQGSGNGGTAVPPPYPDDQRSDDLKHDGYPSKI